MAKIKRVITAEERKQARLEQEEKQRANDERKRRLSGRAKLTQAEINELVIILAREHGLIE